MLDNENLDENYYGKWWGIVDSEFPGYFEQRVFDWIGDILREKKS